MINDSRENSSKNPPLNQILYGPPGTGKTYNTINKALEILDYVQDDESKIAPDDDKSKIVLDYAKIKRKLQEIAKSEDAKALNLENLDSKSDRELAKLLFDYYCNPKQGQIAFVTFHQSFSYEEFVEGIKPKLIDSSEGAESGKMEYEIKSGIFKQICKKALQNLENSQKTQEQIKQELDLQELFEAYLEFVESKINEANFDDPALKIPNSKMIIRKIYRLDNGEGKSLFLGVEGAESMQSLTKDIIFRDYPDYKSGVITSYHDIKPKYESQAKYHGNAIYYFEIFKKMDEFEKSYKPQKQAVDQVKLKPYILIIDEINRGNISKILGELITLIEPSKRIGGDEELRVSLPYSANEFDGGKGFGVPNNLYIIGTMNTADRSIALLDTALRRRFEFVEMMPQPELLEIIKVENGEINLQMLLEKMNARIKFLLDREHTIGHSFFINVNSLSELKQVFKNKIIPLLQEYFYDDYAKIDAVLNGNKMVKGFSKNDLQVNLSDDFVDSDKKIYCITKSSKWNEKNFLRIYNDSVQIDKDE